ncbi:MAG: polysaccharide deacetylase family protein [Clostridia bacterium]|nr:polysaccharide deacetylase family protein [Clostridia bacterium]
MKKIIALAAFCIVLAATCISASAAAKVCTLMYHSVTSDVDRLSDYTVTPEQFENDIRFFMACGYIPMTATELATENFSLIDNRKILLVTLDDGYDNFYTEVFPILQRNNCKATMFLIGSYIDRYGYLNRDQVYEMAHSGLVEIGNHTDAIHHTPVGLLYDIYNDNETIMEVVEDIRRNGIVLKTITGYDIYSLSWPYGYYTSYLDRLIKSQLGYKISFGTSWGVNFFNGNTSTPLKRMNRESSATTKEVFDRANRLLS